MTRRRDYTAVLARACPSCGAAPGDWCRVLRGSGPAHTMHAPRVRPLPASYMRRRNALRRTRADALPARLTPAPTIGPPDTSIGH